MRPKIGASALRHGSLLKAEALIAGAGGKEGTMPIGLEYEMTYRFTVTGPLAALKGSPTGNKQYWEMTAGTITGARINAKIAMPGGDWHVVSEDRFGRPDVRVQFETDDGAIILLHYTGLVERSDAFGKAAERGMSSAWEDQYMRMQMTFDTGAAKYVWLTQSLFVAEGRLSGDKEIEYRIYRLL
jgi:hypothetical protein